MRDDTFSALRRSLKLERRTGFKLRYPAAPQLRMGGLSPRESLPMT
jgi:hypothetical protein